MTRMNGGEAMARLLKAAGTEYIFGIAVGSQSPFIMAAIQLSMRMVTVRDEKAAVGQDAIDAAAQLLLAAQKPAIVAGGGVALSQASGELLELAELLALPVATTHIAHGVFPSAHPLSAGVLGSAVAGNRGIIANGVVNEADALLIVGTRMDARTTLSHTLVSPGTKLVIEAKQLAVDENDRILVWIGEANSAEAPTSPPAPSAPEPGSPPTTEPEREPVSYTPPHLAEKILTSRSALEGERKQVTVLFRDLAHSTAIAERIGAENMHTLLNRFFELALNEVHRYEGTINQFLGDGFMALFGAPISHEDHARRGVLAAWSLQRALKGAELGKPYGVECSFLMGLNSGLVVVGSIGDNLRMDYSAIGNTTNLASRLQQQAEPGEILIHETTARLVQGYMRLETLAPVEIRGKTEPVSVYKVVGTLPRRSPVVSRGERTLSQFVGRERELATLEELFAQVEFGNGQVVGIVAEAGQGKSRLLYEFRQRLAGKQITYLEGRCLSYGQTIPYHPVVDILRNNCETTETDSPETVIDKVRSALHKVGMDAEEFSPYLLQLLGVKEQTESISPLTPEAIRTRTFDTLRQMSLQGSQRRPLIFEIEDLHWRDKTSEDYLAFLVESLPGASILLLTTYRPGYQPSWLGKSYATQISLHSLTSQDALNVVHSTRQNVALADDVAQTIVAKSEGNPFFLEELTRAVIEQGDGETTVEVPDTIQGVLSARIDRLPEVHKRLLQTASVLGREFSPRLVGKIWDGSGSLDALLSELKRMEFLFERTGTGEPVYVFRHALTQDVAYESLLTTRRQTLHTGVGTALETLYPEGLTERSEELAYHFRLGEVWDEAFDYLTRSGDKARQAYANQEAIAFYTQAIEVSGRITPTLDEAQLLPLYERRGLIWRQLAKHEEAIADFQQMRQMARVSGNRYMEGESLGHLGFLHFAMQSSDQIPLIEWYAQEGVQLAQQTGNQHIKPKRPLSRWQPLSRMNRYAPPSYNQRWCKKFTNVRRVWADKSHELCFTDSSPRRWTR